MQRMFARQPSPAMVIACAALLIALGGTSIAAVTAIPNNSVGSAQLKNNAVTNAKIAGNAVTSAKVENHSLLSADFAAGQIPAGPPGPRGPAGTVGKLTLHTASVNVGPSNSSEMTVHCNSGDQAVSGGATWSDKGDLALTLVYSNPVFDSTAGRSTGWVARGRNSTSKNRQFIVQVLCGKAPTS